MSESVSTKLCLVLSPEEKRVALSDIAKCCRTAEGFSSADESLDPVMVAERCSRLGLAGVLVISDKFFDALCKREGIAKAKRRDYAGSMFVVDGVEFVIIPPTVLDTMRGLVSAFKVVPHLEFLVSHYVTKLTKKSAWPVLPEFKWAICKAENVDTIVEAYRDATFIAVDIETRNHPVYGPVITMVGHTAVWIKDGKLRMHTTVVPTTNTWWPDAVRAFAELPAPKCFQGGRYDNAYLQRFDISETNWLFDTMQFFHAWYSELPKDLGAISAFTVRNGKYWKDLAGSSNSYDKLMYNALDCYNTAGALIFFLLKDPNWVLTNYKIKFPMIYPAHMCEMRGAAVDMPRFKSAKKELEIELEAARSELARSVGDLNFNAASPKQVSLLLTVLGAEFKSTNEQSLEALAYGDPFIGLFAKSILDIRGLVKLLGTYFDGGKLFHGRLLSSLLPYGTVTGRNASGEHAFWCGQNMQNIPRGKAVKQYIVPDEGFLLFECDSEQAETRDTAYISGEERLIDAVEGPHDFHSLNCSAFFGVPYDQIYDDVTHKKLMPELRDQAKRVNHGANYVMGANVLVQTMGRKAVDYVRKVLKLPKTWSYKKIGEYLLAQFHATYPGIAKNYYRYVENAIRTNRMLVGATGWTRYCFGNIADKHQYNSYMAHCPSSLNAMRLDKAFLTVFNELSVHPGHSKNIRVIMQIHDSIFGMVRIGHEYLIQEVANRMQIPITIRGCDGKVRTYVVPADIKAGKNRTGAQRWSETE